MGGLYLVRHGQTEHNAQQVLQGPRIDSELSELGMRQAAAVAQALHGVDYEAVFASPLKRARATAQAIVDTRTRRAAVQVVPELYEVDYGDFIGHPYEQVRDDVQQVLDAWRMGFLNESFPGGESALVAQQRVNPFARRLLEQARGEDLCVVAHGRINRILLATLTGMGLGRLEEIPQANGSITELDVSLDGVHVKRLNDTSHMDEPSDSFS